MQNVHKSGHLEALKNGSNDFLQTLQDGPVWSKESCKLYPDPQQTKIWPLGAF